VAGISDRKNESSGPLPAGSLPALPHAALDRLARLHRETRRTSRTARFLGSAVHAASAFMLMGAAVLLWGGGQTLGRNFTWAALVLMGVVALTGSFIRSHAAAFDRGPASAAVRMLRAILFYMGVAWGAGAFLALPVHPTATTVLLFALVPALVLAALLHDPAGLAAFQIPASLLTVAAALAGARPDAGPAAAALLFLQGLLLAAVALGHRARLPAGLALR
jgi:hypothetical protein